METFHGFPSRRKKTENTTVARTPEEQQGPKDSWEDPSDDKEHQGEEDSQRQQKLTDDYPPLQQDGKQQEKPSLLTKLARADRAIMKVLTKITTATGHNDEVAALIDGVLSERSKMKKIIIEQGQEIVFQRGRISELERQASANKKGEEREQ
ncbi:hypothetical protein MTO96_036560 [Rhipicephalus appendiculatus]